MGGKNKRDKWRKIVEGKKKERYKTGILLIAKALEKGDRSVERRRKRLSRESNKPRLSVYVFKS